MPQLGHLHQAPYGIELGMEGVLSSCVATCLGAISGFIAVGIGLTTRARKPDLVHKSKMKGVPKENE